MSRRVVAAESRRTGIILRSNPDRPPVGDATLSPAEVEGLLRDFLAARKPTTIRAYEHDLRDFATRAGAESPRAAMQELLMHGQGAANRTAMRYRTALIEAGLAPATINRRLSALRSLTEFAAWVGVIPWVLRVRHVAHRAYKDTAGPGRAGVAKLLRETEHYDNVIKGLRDRAILLLLYGNALRVSEASLLDVSDYDHARSRLHILGKGSHERTWITLPAPVNAALAAWMSVRGPGAGPLFYRLDGQQHRGKPLTVRGIDKLIRLYGGLCGVHTHAHGLRHSGITTSLDLGLPARSVQKFARHASLQTLRYYDDNREDLGGVVATSVTDDLLKKPA